MPYHRLGTAKYAGVGRPYRLHGLEPVEHRELALFVELGKDYAWTCESTAARSCAPDTGVQRRRSGMSNLLILVGSPRKQGNSALLTKTAEHAARQGGASVERIFLHDLAISPCDGCGLCRKSVDSPCVLDDDMTTLYVRLRAADAILIATPIYSYNMTAQTKLLLDRLYALGSAEGNALSGKRFGFVVVYGGANPFTSGAATAMRCLHDTFARKASWMRIVHGTAAEPRAAAKDPELMAAAAQLGADLVADSA